MATTKPKYGQQAVSSIKHLSETTLTDLREVMRRKPSAELINRIEVAITWSRMLRDMPTPAETRAALEELFRKSFALWTLFENTDQYTLNRIREVTSLDTGVVVDPVGDASQSLSRLLAAIGKTRSKVWSADRTGGRNKTRSQTTTLRKTLHVIFKESAGKLRREQMDSCVDVIMENLPG